MSEWHFTVLTVAIDYSNIVDHTRSSREKPRLHTAVHSILIAGSLIGSL